MRAEQCNHRCSRAREGNTTRAVRAKRWQTEDGFRLIRTFTPDHNAARFVTHMARMKREWARAPGAKRFAMKMRRRKGSGA